MKAENRRCPGQAFLNKICVRRSLRERMQELLPIHGFYQARRGPCLALPTAGRRNAGRFQQPVLLAPRKYCKIFHRKPLIVRSPATSPCSSGAATSGSIKTCCGAVNGCSRYSLSHPQMRIALSPSIFARSSAVSQSKPSRTRRSSSASDSQPWSTL